MPYHCKQCNSSQQNKSIILSLTSFAITLALGSSIITTWKWLKPCPVKREFVGYRIYKESTNY